MYYTAPRLLLQVFFEKRGFFLLTFFSRSGTYPIKKGVRPIKTVIYLDVLLLVNFAVGCLFLLAAGLLTGFCCSALRLLLGAGVAAASSLSLLWPEQPWPLALLYKVSTGVLSVWAAYGWPGVRGFGQLAVWFWLLNLLLTGAVLLPGAECSNFSVYLPLSPGLLLSSAAGIYLILQAVLHIFGKTTSQCMPGELVLTPGAEPLPVRVLRDTGFSVQEPLSGREVVLVRFGAVRAQLPPPLGTYLEQELSGTGPPPDAALGVRMVPCNTVAGHCLLPAVPAQLLRVWNANGTGRPQTRRELYAAFCDTPAPPGGWTLLMGG